MLKTENSGRQDENMNNTTKLFILENDCERLVSLMLWLDQYGELEVHGCTADGAEVFQQIIDFAPDVILIDPATLQVAGVPNLKQIRSGKTAPAIVVMGDGSGEFDGQVNLKTGLKEIPETISRAVNRHRVAQAAVFMPMSKAS